MDSVDPTQPGTSTSPSTPAASATLKEGSTTATPSRALKIRQLDGLQDYQTIWSQMKRFVEIREPESTDEIWLLQHNPVFTLGQAGKTEHILDPGPIPIVQSDRGGQVTYHGPGQLVVYLMIDAARKGWRARELVQRIEQSLITLLQTLGITSHSRSDAPGVYTDQHGSKIASLGLRMKRQSSYHGLALNIDMDLTPFHRINPCGYAGMMMTQVKDCMEGFQPETTFKEIETTLCDQLKAHLDYQHTRNAMKEDHD